jgi:hypothetical protein
MMNGVERCEHVEQLIDRDSGCSDFAESARRPLRASMDGSGAVAKHCVRCGAATAIRRQERTNANGSVWNASKSDCAGVENREYIHDESIWG